MRSLLLIIVLGGLISELQAQSQSPHGNNLKMDCAACHRSDSWEIPADAWSYIAIPAGLATIDTARFHHDSTDFPLLGQHTLLDCRACHETLVFEEASNSCISCHTDMHNQTVGTDCARCHSIENWLVDNITALHYDNGFPLLGVHAAVSCNACHQSDSELQFPRIGNDCINCHLDDFNGTNSPNHLEAGFSLDCIDCHDFDGFSWSSGRASHDFFPLTKGHAISDCTKCHIAGNFSNTPTDCIACHQTDFDNAQSPNHQTANFSTNCIDCHTTDIGWMPAKYTDHDGQYFPIYTGEHAGVWNACMDCHTNPSNYAEYSCTVCHTNPETDNEHNGVGGYMYENTGCLVCHPTGSADDNFDHNQTNFPLHGAHTTVNCINCHSNGYAGTPTACVACHLDDYNNTTSPNHSTAQFSTDCETCHTENAWTPSTFDHDDGFPIYSGKHKGEWSQCVECHTTPSNFALFSCIDCHEHNDQADLDDEHNDVSGYSYSSSACYSCHPTGEE